jgi:hypothetical protein
MEGVAFGRVVGISRVCINAEARGSKGAAKGPAYK